MRKASQRAHSGGVKVFITGVSGFIGPAVAEDFIARGFKVSGLVRKSSRPSPAVERLRGKMDFYEGDITDFSGMRKILETVIPDYILHFGNISPVSYSFDHPIEVNRNNFIGTMCLAEAAREVLPKLKGFLFASSMETYGEQKHIPFTEDLETHPLAPYAVSKVACEKYLELLWRVYKFPTLSVRQTNCYGRKDNDYFVIEAIITQMLKSKTVNLGRGEPVRNFIHIDDLCNFYLTVLDHIEHKRFIAGEVFGQVFNTGPTNGLTIRHLQEKIARLMNWEGKVNWNTREIRAGEVMYLNSNGGKASSTFGWFPKTKLDEGLQMTINYWKKKIQYEKDSVDKRKIRDCR